MMKKDILILVGQSLFAESLSESIKNKRKDCIVDTFNSKDELLLQLKGKKNVIVILDDVDTCHGNYSLINELLKTNEDVKIIFIGNIVQIKNIRKLFEIGIKSYLDENAEMKDLLKAFSLIEDNNIYISDSTKEKMMNYFSFEESKEKKQINYDLTIRERDVLKYICEGLNGKEISDKLFISTNTVETHRRNIMMKLNVKNSICMVKYALEQNII